MQFDGLTWKVCSYNVQRIAVCFSQVFQFGVECAPFLDCHVGPEKTAFVYKMDQTSIFVDMKAATTIEFVGKQNLNVVQTMSTNSFRASLSLCANAVGVKVRPLIVFTGVLDATAHKEF
ncbi:hypothetical protein PybrP1_007802 [[Pythium] brassicae (nom. inval.)]|nr:hypothetical protein PybrP1_007802 [[Pythium] brassicae (nom. inval.)]